MLNTITGAVDDHHHTDDSDFNDNNDAAVEGSAEDVDHHFLQALLQPFHMASHTGNIQLEKSNTITGVVDDDDDDDDISSDSDFNDNNAAAAAAEGRAEDGYHHLLQVFLQPLHMASHIGNIQLQLYE